MPSKKSDNSTKDKDKEGSKGMNINWMNIVTLLIVVSAIITILLMYLLGNSFVKDDKGYIQKIYTQEIHEYPKDPSVDDDKEHKGDEKGITVKNKTVFEEDVKLNKKLTFGATTELGTEAVPLAKLYVKEIVTGATDAAPKVLKKTLSANGSAGEWKTEDVLEVMTTGAATEVTVTLPTEKVAGKLYTVVVVATATGGTYILKTTDNVFFQSLSTSAKPFTSGGAAAGTIVQQFTYAGSSWYAL